MKTIKIPYHNNTLDLLIEEKNLKSVLYAGTKDFRSDKSEKELIYDALKSPIGSRRLRDIARDKKHAVIVTSDHTRAVPSKITLPILLEEIRHFNPGIKITILIATGLHRPTALNEQIKMFGEKIVSCEEIEVNDAFDRTAFDFVGFLPSGSELWVNKIALNCDLLVTEGFIEPHFFAGFSGGRKSILPGICNEVTVNENHSYKAISHPNSKTGVLSGNPIHEDMVFAARKVNVQFILNVALDESKKVIGAFAGDLEKAHEKGVDFVRSLAQCTGSLGDIVITSNGGYPLDQNLYQSPKAISTAARCCRDGGVIIMCAGCVDGVGGKNFERMMTMGSVEEINDYLSKIPPKESISEQWCVQIFAQILKHHTVILVTNYLDHDFIRKANMLPSSSLDEAMEVAYGIMGKDAEVIVIPDGVSVFTGQEE